jgi:hypothetical protein
MASSFALARASPRSPSWRMIASFESTLVVPS